MQDGISRWPKWLEAYSKQIIEYALSATRALGTHHSKASTTGHEDPHSLSHSLAS